MVKKAVAIATANQYETNSIRDRLVCYVILGNDQHGVFREPDFRRVWLNDVVRSFEFGCSLLEAESLTFTGDRGTCDKAGPGNNEQRFN